MSDDIVREVRVLVDASVCTNPPIHKYSKFDRTLVIPLLEEAERLRYEVEQLRREVGELKDTLQDLFWRPGEGGTNQWCLSGCTVSRTRRERRWTWRRVP
jgi:hypothetical protein